MECVGFTRAIGATDAYPPKQSFSPPIIRSGEGGCSLAGPAGAAGSSFWLSSRQRMKSKEGINC